MKRSLRQIAKPVLRALTARLYRGQPISTWPALMGRIHEISVPRGVVPHATRRPIGTANINNILYLLEKTRDIPGDIAECGVFRGHSLVPIGIYLQQKQIPKSVFGFDSFEGFPATLTLDAQWTEAEGWKHADFMAETSLDLVKAKLLLFQLERIELVRGFFEESLHKVSTRTFSFVHLDVDSYSSYKECISFFYPRLSSGGAMLFDEYNDPPWPGCNRAVDEFLSDKPEILKTIAKDNYEKYYIIKS